MGEARRRGSFEDRKAQAIEAGRIKGEPTFRQKISAANNHLGALLDVPSMLALFGVRERTLARARRRGR